MQNEVRKWGNSLALRLPKHILEAASLKEGSPVDLTIENGALVVRPTRKKFKLSELLEGHPQPRADAENQEFDWGAPQGEEEW